MNGSDPYMGFKKQIGYTLVVAAVLYGICKHYCIIYDGMVDG